jgi:hypothetical protein
MAALDSLSELAPCAVYDSRAQALVVPPALRQVQPLGDEGCCPAAAALSRLLAGFGSHVGMQHVKALQQLSGGEGLAALAHALVGAFEQQVQGPLCGSLLQLQPHLPASLRSAPAFDQRASAGKLLGSYRRQLSGALGQPELCHDALAALQAAGNCLALLQLVDTQLAVDASPAFMQAAPLLGIRTERARDVSTSGLVMPPPAGGVGRAGRPSCCLAAPAAVAAAAAVPSRLDCPPLTHACCPPHLTPTPTQT